MTTTKLDNTKSASRTINYTEKSSLNCDVYYAKSTFKQIKALYSRKMTFKHIQSFNLGEVTPE